MQTQWILQTQGDPVGSVQKFLGAIWPHAAIDGILLPIRTTETPYVTPYLIDSPDQLKNADPFAPIMQVNTAKLVAELTHEYPYNSFAAILRSCEMRALVEMLKHDSFQLDRVFLIGIDCLSTYPESDYLWRAQRKHGVEELTSEVLNFARLGGILEGRFRPACQMCEYPSPEAVDISISVIGVPVQEHILIISHDEATATTLQLQDLTDGRASHETIERQNHILNKLAERRKKVRQRLTASLSAELPRDVDALIDWMETCDDCIQCLEACPICAIEFPSKNDEGRFLRDEVMHWLISCADCGLCEQSCPKEMPLATIFGFIRRELAKTYDYTAGGSFTTPLPEIQ